MKKLKFQYKAFPLNRLWESLSQRSYKLWFTSTFLFVVVLSCAMTQEANHNENADKGIIEHFVDKYFGNRYSVQAILTGSHQPLFKIAESSCSPEETDLAVALEVKWESLTFPIEFSTQLGSPEGSKDIIFSTPQRSYSISSRGVFTKEKLAQLCSIVKSKGSTIELEVSDPFVMSVKTALSQLAPDCNIALDEKGFSCTGSTYTLAELQTKAFRTYQRVLDEFQRLPYLMVRKSSTLRQFALVYDSEAGINSFCRLNTFAIQEELPLAFRSNLWKKTVCNDRRMAGWKSVAADGMELAVRELELLSSLAGDTTKKGALAVRVSSNFKALWVQLTPTDSVAQSFQTAIQNEQSRLSAQGVKGVCWHPIFDENPELQQISSAIGLSHRSPGACDYKIDDKAPQAWKYLANALNGETSFVVDNMRSKVLQLPFGDYNYRIFPMPADPRSERAESGLTIASGSVNWSAKSRQIVLQ